MRRIILILMLLCLPNVAKAQQNQVLSAASSTCSTTSCLSTSVDQTQGGTTFTITANASGNTIQFEGSGDGGTTWVALNATPSNSTTAATSSSSVGTWQANVAGYTNIRMRMSSLVGGTTTVSMIQSTASARAGGAVGAGGGVTSFSGDGTVITNSASTGAVTTTIAGTSGGIPCFNSASTWTSSGAVAARDAITGGGAGACAQDSLVPISQGTSASNTNVAIGTTAMVHAGNTGTRNVAIGNSALGAVASSDLANVAVGYHALQSQSGSGGTNTAVGDSALASVLTGAGDTAVGQGACTATTGGTDTCIGLSTATSAVGDTNETMLGNAVTGGGSNTATIGNASVTDVFMGSSTPKAAVHDSSEIIGGGNTFGSNITFTATACETAFAPTTLSTIATTTTTGVACLPANSIIDAVVARVTTTITASCTGWELGDGTTAARFSSNNATLTSGTVTDAAHIGTFNNTGIASATTGIWQAAAHGVVVTCATGNPGAGAIRIIVYSHTWTAPTS